MTLQSEAHQDPEIARLAPWFHNLHLPDGRETAPDHPLGDFPAYKWRAIGRHLAADLDGATVLDLGCNAGYYTFELARRGAHVTALDVDEHYLAQARWAAGQYGCDDRIEFRRGSVYDLAAETRKWDIVLFMGVLYHLRYPLLALDLVARSVGELLVLQTLTMPGNARLRTPANLPLEERDRLCEPGWPKLAFVEHRLADDETNWWAPNAAAVEAMVRSAGLTPLLQPVDETWICRPGPARSFPELTAASAAVKGTPR